MKATLTFGDDERYELMVALSGSRLSSVLWDFDQWLRSEIKHNDRDDLQEVRTKLWQFLEDYSVSLNDDDPPLRIEADYDLPEKDTCFCGRDDGPSEAADGDGEDGGGGAPPVAG